jgi:hypothetical protein
MPHLTAQVVHVPPQVPGREDHGRLQDPLTGVAAEGRAVDPEELRGLSGGQQLARVLPPRPFVPAYTCLWSHPGAVPGHIHYVVQPVTHDQVATSGLYGPALQMQMFRQNATPADDDIARIAQRARDMFARPAPASTL